MQHLRTLILLAGICASTMAGFALSAGAGAMAVVASAAAAQAEIAGRMGALLGQERAALDRVRPDHIGRILAPPAPPVDPGKLYSASWIASQPLPAPEEELSCLARALYFEARGEGIKGQFAVAEVILNRAAVPDFPDSICGVVYQGVGNGRGCQFSFACDGRPETIGERGAYATAKRIAGLMLQGAPHLLTDGATHFHTRAVRPAWARSFPRTAAIGAHLFYRQPLRLSAN